MSLSVNPAYSFQAPKQILSLPAQPGATSPAYILSIDALADANKLLLSHGTSILSVVDKESFKVVDTWQCPEGQGHIVDVAVDLDGSGRVWTCGKEGAVAAWGLEGAWWAWAEHRQERQGVARLVQLLRLEDCCVLDSILAPGGKPTPLLSIASAPQHHLIAAGTELTSHEASIIYWDVRNAAQPLHVNTSLHSDDITSLSFAPASLHSTSFPHPPSSSPSDSKHTPSHTSAILLSSSTDGLIALSDGLEPDEDESVLGMGNGNVSVARAGWMGGSEFGGWGVWGRDDMDGVSWWDARDFTLDCAVPSLRVATEPSVSPSWETDYLVDVIPNLPVSLSSRVRGCIVGSNIGDTSLLSSTSTSATPEQFTLDRTFKSGFRGHRDVVRAALYDPSTHSLFTGSEDSVLCAWTIDGAPAFAEGPSVAVEDVAMDEDSASGLASAPSAEAEESRMDEDEELGGGKRRRHHVDGEDEEERKRKKKEKKERKERKRREAEGKQN